ncbi:hypothetical protein JCM19233_5162 [Vibrio astriarenae]|nr:hypothetical protein JCM19233_5162 [Vibrio sp. C7]
MRKIAHLQFHQSGKREPVDWVFRYSRENASSPTASIISKGFH